MRNQVSEKVSLQITEVKRIHLLHLFLLFFVSVQLQSATRYWIGGASTNWSNNNNWGNASGSGAPQSFPVAGDVVIFDGGGLSNCILTANVNMTTLTISAAYTGTITQGIYTINISGNSTWGGGTFAGGSANITNTGTFTLSGTNFTSTSAILNIRNTFNFTSGTFNHNNGLVTFTTNTFGITGSPIFNNVTLSSNLNNITFNSSLTVAGDLTFNATGGLWMDVTIAGGQTITVNGAFNLSGTDDIDMMSGTIDVKGNINITNTNTGCFGAATISITGTGNQTLTGSGTFNNGALPNVIINKTAGALTLASTITIAGNWTYTAGTINAGTSLIYFYKPASGTDQTISGTHTLNNVVFYPYYSNPTTINNDLTVNNLTFDTNTSNVVAINSSITVNGTLLVNNSANDILTINTGTIYARGDITLASTNASGGGGSGTINISGTGNQTLTGTALSGRCRLPNIVINKTSGTLNLANFIYPNNNFTHTAGTVNAGTSTVTFLNALTPPSSITTNGMSFFNVTIGQPDYSRTRLLSNITVNGDLTINASCGLQTNNFNIDLKGNFTCSNTTSANCFQAGTGTVTLTGSGPGTQTILTNNAVFYNLVVNNTASRVTNDDVTLSDDVMVTNSATFTNGIMLCTATNYLYMRTGSTANIGNAASFVNGPMRYDMAFNGSRTLNFPVGKNANWRYVTLNLSHNAATSYTYTTEVFEANANAFGFTLPSTITNVSYMRYTQIDRTITGGAASNANLSGNQQITMYYSTDDVVVDFTNLTIAKTTASGTPWADIGGIATANTTGTITSTSNPTAFTAFSRFSLANKLGGGNPLPIGLLNFTAITHPEDVLLNWTTASEANNDFFTVEKSKDAMNFEEVGLVNGAGTTSNSNSYSLLDDSPFNGVSYYRLKQTDYDGAVSYSDIVPVNFVEASNTAIRIYPNPYTDDGLNLLLANSTRGSIQVLIYDLSGNICFSDAFVTGNNNLHKIYTLDKLEPGVYTVIVKTNTEVSEQKLLIK